MLGYLLFTACLVAQSDLRNLGCSCQQGRIYVANEYPTFARTMLMVRQKITFSRQNSLNVRQNLSVLMENMQL